MDNMDKKWLEAAMGKATVDLLLKDARVINVFSGSIDRVDIAVHRGRFLGPGAYKARKVIGLGGMYLAPGFIDGHCHLESTMLTPLEFAKAVVPHGTTAVVADPHEIANVLGMEGIGYLVGATKGVPFRFYFMLPSCVPATELETSGFALTAQDLALMAQEKWVLGLGEMMNFPGVIHGDDMVLEKIRQFHGRPIDGHAPGLSGKLLNAYISCGIRSDHECTSLKEAKEKLERGVWIMIREGSTAKNLEDLIPLVNERTVRRCLLVTDDRSPQDLHDRGHLDVAIEKAVVSGLDPVLAIQMVTLNPAEYFGLRDLGAIGPGYLADAVVLSRLRPPRVEMVFHQGRLIWEKGRATGSWGRAAQKGLGRFSIGHIELEALRVAARRNHIRVIGLVPRQIVTTSLKLMAKVQDGVVVSDPSRDVLKLVVVERHRGTGRIGIGFVKGFGLKSGALASSVSHDSHNVVAVGVEDTDLLRAITALADLKGGLVVVNKGKVMEKLPLPIAGLISPWALAKVAERHGRVIQAAVKLGCTLEDPFMTLSFLALPVIPALKLTDRGLVDVNEFKVVDLFE